MIGRRDVEHVSRDQQVISVIKKCYSCWFGGQSDRMASNMEVHMKKRCVNEFLHNEKNSTN